MYIESDIGTWTEEDYNRNLAEVSRLFNAPIGTPDGDRLDVLLSVVGDYEDRHHAIPKPSAETLDAFRKEQRGELFATAR
jgi:HTH-type transcriptional regulator/antitoxin HigA